ncbi:visual pigment-like receptor peropsin [Oculina patagonica]
MDGKIHEVFDHHIYNTIAAFYIIIMLATIVLNGIAILTFYKVRSLLTPGSLPTLSLALAGLLLAIAAMPLGVAANTSQRWFLGEVGCNWYAFAHTVVGLSSVLHHTVIAVEAHRRIVQVMNTPTGKKEMIVVILVVWGIVAIWGCMPFVGWSSYVGEGSGAVCSINWKSTDPAGISYVICTFMLFLIVPVIVTVACYVAISKDLKVMAKKIAKKWGQNAQRTIERVAAMKKSIRTGVIMFLAAFFVWLPYAVVSVMSAFGSTPPPLAFAISAVFAKTSALINPIVCFFWYRKFRIATKKIFGISHNQVRPQPAILQKANVVYCNGDVKIHFNKEV